jgi:hypothetical protein
VSNVALVSQPDRVDLRLYQGDDFAMTLTVTNPDGSNYDLTGCTIAAQIRATPGANQVLATFTVSYSGNVITLQLPHAQAVLVAGQAAYDCQITDSNGFVTTLIYGDLVMAAEVTR